MIILFATMAFKLLSIPILTDVSITDNESITIKYKIVNFEKDIEIELGCFKNQTEIKINTNHIKGDIFSIQSKQNYSISINKLGLPKDFNLKEYRILPKMIYQDRIYYEMQEIKKGSYPLKSKDNVIELIDTYKFYISKFEITNEQFAAFVDADGYEFQEYWDVSSNLMSKNDIGWYYLAKFKMALPLEWSFKDLPYYQKASSNFKYGPVTDIRWFEAHAFANWMQCELPTFDQMCVGFALSKSSADSMFTGIAEFSNGKYPIQKIHDGVAEWLESGVEPTSMSCAGCNEMYFIENSSDYLQDNISYAVKCPLFRAPFLGSRIVINANRSKIK